MNISEERLEEIRKATMEEANPSDTPSSESGNINRYLDITPENEIISNTKNSEKTKTTEKMSM